MKYRELDYLEIINPNYRWGVVVAKKIALIVVLVAGVVWMGSAIAFSYPAKTQAVDNLTNAFRPTFTNAGIKQAKSDIATINQFASQFQTKAVPALAQELHLTPAQLVGAVSTQYPEVGKGIAQLPTSLPYFNHLVDGLAAQQHNFQLADAIPTKNLPTTTVYWLFFILGLIAVAVALVGLFLRRQLARAMFVVSLVLGLAVIGVSLMLSVPTKAQAVDNLTNAFRPVFTTQGAAQTREYLTNVQNMDKQLTSAALPGLASMLKVTPAQLDASLGQNFPAVATGLQQMPAILSRFNVLVTGIQQNVGNFQLADSIPTKNTPTTLLQGQLVGPAGVIALVGLLGLVLSTATTRDRKQALQLKRENEASPARVSTSVS